MNNIASERIRLGLEQRDLSKNLDVSISTISKWERGKVLPNSVALVKMHKLFGCSTDYLLGLTDERKPNR